MSAEQEAARLQRRADVQAGRDGCAGDLVHWRDEFSGVKRPWKRARPPFWWSSYRKGLWEAGYSERHAKFLRGEDVP